MWHISRCDWQYTYIYLINMNKPRIFPREEIFHICNKSISNYKIFRTEKYIRRFITTINYYNNLKVNISLSKAIKKPLDMTYIMSNDSNRIFSLLAYCIMPDHYHLLVKVNSDFLLAKFMNNLENSYSHYYNLSNNRKGPLWQSRFRSSHIEDNETLLHVHRYIHLNPSTTGLTNKPEDWPWSSYNYFITNIDAFSTHKEISICSVPMYRKFVEDQISYQRTIKGIRRKLLE